MSGSDDFIIYHHVTCANHPGKDNIVMVIVKNTILEKDEFYEYSYNILRIYRRFIITKRQWCTIFTSQVRSGGAG